MAYLQIYKNRLNAYYSHSVLKGDDLYEVNITSGEKMRWRYLGKIDPKVFQINGTLIHNPPIKTIVILQRMLQPIKKVNESFIEGSIWRSANQKWLEEFINNHGFINHKDNFISFSFDSESGGQDSFGGAEVTIEFDENEILKQGKKQELGPVEYTEEWMKEHPKICGSVTGHRSKKSYYDSINVKNDKEAWESQNMTWDSYIESSEHEKEIVLHKLQDREGLIKNIIFNIPADISLINKLQRKNIPYTLKQGLEKDPQRNLKFESFQNWLKEYKKEKADQMTEVLYTSGSSSDSSPWGYDSSQPGYRYKSRFPIVEDDDEDEEIEEDDENKIK